MAHPEGNPVVGTAALGTTRGALSTEVETAAAAALATDDEFTPLRVKQVVRETADAVSLVLDAPETFGYHPGQFITVRVGIDGQQHRRCYSMSSSPVVGEDLRITVKRDGRGVVSNWLNGNVTVGDRLEAAAAQGRFLLTDTGRDLVAFAGGSGITPVFSLIRSALAASDRRVRLFYANRGPDSVIFGEALARLRDSHPDRFVVHHHLDEDSGVIQSADVESFVGSAGDAEVYVCGPAPFMDTVELAVIESGVATERLHLERFKVAVTAPSEADAAAPNVTEEVSIELDRHTATVPYRVGNTLLQTARTAGFKAPASCETGSCGTCMARVVEGSARMLNNDALDDDEVAEGWVLTCQSLPTSPSVRVVYE